MNIALNKNLPNYCANAAGGQGEALQPGLKRGEVAGLVRNKQLRSAALPQRDLYIPAPVAQYNGGLALGR